MSKLALLGGTPITEDLLSGARLPKRTDLERRYLIEAHDSGVWDDWPGVESQAALFEREWAEFNSSKHCALLTNGTHTLQVALETLDIGYGDEVIVPALTWQATASVVCDVNATPVLVDVDPHTLCIDVSGIEAAITPRTRAIVPVHLYSRLADLDGILEIAARHDVHVIEDCAHVHGSRWADAGAGTVGSLGSYSFQASKLMTAGEGGALLMQDEELYWKVVSQRSCGREFRAGIKVHSGNYRMTSLQAAVLRGQLAALTRNAPVIGRISRIFDAVVDASPGVSSLRRNEHVTEQTGYSHVFLFDPAAFDGVEGPTFRKALSAELGFHFGTTYAPLHRSEVYYPHSKRRHALSPEYVEAITPTGRHLPAAEEAWRSRAVVSLWPIYACPPERAVLLGDAINKIFEHRHELLTGHARTTGTAT
jgi:L-glutamine:2-deoxy-scyllo-inosose/3-amino-2,3-dideoxy-scyllo-inosose aminotransferase